MTITFHAHGIPKGQPRARAVIRGKHAGVYDPGTANAWKHAVADAWRLLGHAPIPAGPLMVKMEFYFPRPKSHFGTGKNAGRVKETAPAFHLGPIDADNLAKAVLDELTRIGAWRDDADVFHLTASRHWEDVLNFPGCYVTITAI